MTKWIELGGFLVVLASLAWISYTLGRAAGRSDHRQWLKVGTLPAFFVIIATAQLTGLDVLMKSIEDVSTLGTVPEFLLRLAKWQVLFVLVAATAVPYYTGMFREAKLKK